MTVKELTEYMDESEFQSWQHYARRRWLPHRRLELLLANVARLSGGADSLTPFVFDPALRELLTPKATGTATMAAGAFAAMTGTGRIYRLGQKRKKVIHG